MIQRDRTRFPKLSGCLCGDECFFPPSTRALHVWIITLFFVSSCNTITKSYIVGVLFLNPYDTRNGFDVLPALATDTVAVATIARSGR